MEEAEVVAYLRAHPDLLDKHPDLVAVLTPPGFQRNEGVLDLQRFMVEKLRKQITELQSQFKEMVFSARDNQTALNQVQQAVVQLVGGRDRAEISQIIHQQMANDFGLDVVRLCMEVDIPDLQEGADPEGMATIPSPLLKDMLRNSPVYLAQSIHLEDGLLAALCGSSAPLIGSLALVAAGQDARGYRRALLLATRDATLFQPGQGTDLLQFLGKVLAVILQQRWDHDTYLSASRQPDRPDGDRERL